MTSKMDAFPAANGEKNALDDSRNLVFALAGNANVGKSVLFNHLTGSSQIIGNWPGKTIERAQGTLKFEGQKNYCRGFTWNLLILNFFYGGSSFKGIHSL